VLPDAAPDLSIATMEVAPLAVAGAWRFTPRVFPDARGSFAAPLQEEPFVRAVGHPPVLAQVSASVSHRGVLRGIHYADVPPGQAKYVYCPAGALLDVVVDLRVGSPTFGRWDAVRLDATTMTAVYLPEGVGHGFLALEDHTVTQYLLSTAYRPAAEHGVDPLDPALGLPWTTWADGADLVLSDLVLSDKDRAAPTLDEARRAGALPAAHAGQGET
jgi:dTDP-4-dehydrorhamnose 3,5-epimerase